MGGPCALRPMPDLSCWTTDMATPPHQAGIEAQWHRTSLSGRGLDARVCGAALLNKECRVRKESFVLCAIAILVIKTATAFDTVVGIEKDKRTH